jgi:hypothetical protein
MKSGPRIILFRIGFKFSLVAQGFRKAGHLMFCSD